ncbi:hypothetical protein SLEP1_g45367 [Rubroshorea leprosula]|uniref:Integrase catalytic domain-containing protein n=1 Tax=Rubroshorea leprosula TaxID=152421 RepID=A0AAV5LIU3_9ROSI|nr:hypothetical protein SLEP1_g45367 [Rubroshorea leprosula]
MSLVLIIFDTYGIVDLVEGIQSQRSCPTTPQQNGIAERKNRHILEVVRTLLSTSHAPPNFWVEAAFTTIYLINRIPSEVLHNTSPYYSLHKCHPDYSRLHVFGCVCFVHLPSHERTKLSNQAAMCVFVGYGIDQKGFLCYDPKIGRIRISRHVVFLENLFYFDVIAKPNNSSPSVLHDFSLDHNAPVEQISIDQFHVADEQTQTCSFHQPKDGTLVDAQSVSDSNPASNAANNSIVSLRRSAHTIRPPDRLNLFTSVSLLTTLDFVDIPRSYQEAVSIPCWKEAMDSELSALLENDTWDMVPCPSNVSIIGSRWVFSVKFKADGSIERYKARLVAQGYKQEYGIDYIETFAPVAKMTTVRLLIALSAMHQWPISQMDVKNAFLHGNLKETIYMKPSPGRLLYLTMTRPDIPYAVQVVSQFVADPRQLHLTAVLLIIQYLRGTISRGLFFSSHLCMQLQAFADADWASCLDTRRSTTSWCVFLGDSLISWKCKKQKTVSKSTAEAEYRAMSSTCSKLTWLQGFLQTLTFPTPPSPLYADNMSAIRITSNPVFHECTKHIEVDCHFIRNMYLAGAITLPYIASEHQITDIFTKAMTTARHKFLVSKLTLVSQPQFEGECRK